MHELSISSAIATVVLDHAGGRHVESVHVRVGALRQIVPESLTFCWDMLSRQHPLLAESVLKIEQVPGVIHCTGCDRRSTLSEYSLRCPACGEGLVRVVSGEECLVTSIDVADAVDEAAAGSGDSSASEVPDTPGAPGAPGAPVPADAAR